MVEQTEAVYPAIAKQVRAEGLVRIQITVSDQGVVTAGAAAEIEEIKKLQKTLP